MIKTRSVVFGTMLLLSTGSYAQVMYVPVVFHIVYANDAQNISDEQIYLQLQVINEDFSMTNDNAGDTKSEFKSVAADVGIRFYLADVDNAITRTSTAHGPFFNDDLHLTSMGGRDAYHTDRYLNVWVADLTPDLFGYGSSPGTSSFKDGVAVHYEYFGKDEMSSSRYRLGRTLTHEVGHWLGLQHLWGTSGNCETDDGLTDTPPQSGPAAGCDLNMESCGGLNMVQNFMNTSYDECMTLFTKQQKELMRSTLITLREKSYSTEPPLILGTDSDVERSFIYPNPLRAGHSVYLRSTDPEIDITIIDSTGRVIRSEHSTSLDNEYSIAVDDLSNGVYLVRVLGDRTNRTDKIHINLN